MAVITLAVQQITSTGIDLTDNGSLSTGDTYKFPNDGRTFLHFKKTGAGSCNVTIATPRTDADGNAIADKVVAVPATTGDVMIGPFPASVYNDSDGNVSFTLSSIAGLTVALARL